MEFVAVAAGLAVFHVALVPLYILRVVNGQRLRPKFLDEVSHSVIVQNPKTLWRSIEPEPCELMQNALANWSWGKAKKLHDMVLVWKLSASW